MNISNSKLSLDDFVVVAILLLPFLRYYSVPVLGMGFESLITIFLLGMCILLFLSKKRMARPLVLIESRKWYVVFVAWLILVTLFYELFTDINVNSTVANYNMNALTNTLYIAVIIGFILGGYVKLDCCIKMYTWLVRLTVVIYILQWLIFLQGTMIDFKLPFAYSSAWEYMSEKVFGMTPYPTSLFSEKSHMCEFLVPYIVMCLYSKTLVATDRMKKAVFYTIVVASTVSGNGVVLLFLVWALYFIIFVKFRNPNYKILVSSMGVVVLLGGFFLLNSIPRFNEMFTTLFVDSTGSEYVVSKADYRIYRGLDIFSKLPIETKFLGVGYNHMYLYSRKFSIVSEFDYSWQEVYEYFSAISMVLLYSGLIGTFACLKHFWALCKSKSNTIRGLVIVMLALWFSTEMLFNGTHIMYITLLVAVLFFEQKELIIQSEE